MPSRLKTTMSRRAWLQAVTAWGLASWARLLPADEPEAIEALVRALMEQYEVPGLSLAIARQGQLVLQRGFGLADRDRREPVTPEHLFRIASVTKPITSAAIYTLIEQGRLAAEAFIFGAGGVLGEDFGRTAQELGRIKLIHLLTHTAGGWENQENDPICWAALVNTRAAGIDLALDRLLWRIAKAHPAWEA